MASREVAVAGPVPKAGIGQAAAKAARIEHQQLLLRRFLSTPPPLPCPLSHELLSVDTSCLDLAWPMSLRGQRTWQRVEAFAVNLGGEELCFLDSCRLVSQPVIRNFWLDYPNNEQFACGKDWHRAYQGRRGLVLP